METAVNPTKIKTLEVWTRLFEEMSCNEHFDHNVKSRSGYHVGDVLRVHTDDESDGFFLAKVEEKIPSTLSYGYHVLSLKKLI